MPITVNIGKFPGSIQSVALEDDATVSDALSVSGISDEGYEIRLNGCTASSSDSLDEGDSVILTRRIKGNQHPIVVRVGRVPGRLAQISVTSGITVAGALDEAGVQFDSSCDSLSVNGVTTSNTASVLEEDSSVLITAKVKGNN
jgi:putative ubiquitin-RnfH superfamily antitoxin RatB of RatAB toxin-antitoxin module